MRFYLNLFILFPLWIWSASTKRIDVVHNWTPDPNDQQFAQHPLLNTIEQTLELGNYRLEITDLSSEKDDPSLFCVVLFNKPEYLKKDALKRIDFKKRVLFMWEPPVVQPQLYDKEFLKLFKRIYTWDDDLVDNKTFFKFYYPSLVSLQPNLPSFEDRKLVTQISARKKSKHPKELYSSRLNVIHFFEDLKEDVFDFYGHGWDKRGFRNYKGSIANKLDTLKKYRFSICFENMKDVKGYITEKIFDCFAVGTIPIYWGASNITDYIPKECFIDYRDFGSIDKVYDYIRNMTPETYHIYLKKIEKFLNSNQAKLFSGAYFDVTFLDAVRFP